MNKKIFIKFCFILSAIVVVAPCFAQNAIIFSPKKSVLSGLIKPKIEPKLYLPLGFYIGEQAKFIVKGEPGSFVSLAMSDKNTGASLAGIKLRLGENIQTIEDVIPPSGVIELKLDVPNDKNLNGNVKYFEAVIWKNKDYSDIQTAKIILPSGNESSSNRLVCEFRPKSNSIPSFMPALPGASPELIRSMQYIQEDKEGAFNENYEFENYNSQSVIIRNLRAPQLQQNNKE